MNRSILAGALLLAACAPEALPGEPAPCDCAVEDPELDGDFVFSERRRTEVRLEAEDFAGLWMRQWNLVGFSGWGFVVSNANQVSENRIWARLELEAGRYTVWVRAFADESDRAFQAEVNGTRLPATHGLREGPGAFEWQRAGEVEVEAGPAEVAFVDAGLGFEAVDALVLTTAGAAPKEPELRTIAAERVKPMIVSDMVARADRYAAERPLPLSRGDWLARAEELRPRIMHAIGLDPLPERTPLEATLTGTTQREGYRIERVLFQSRPDFLVDANVFVPDGSGPFPVVLSPIGHWGDKSHPMEATRAHALAKLGYLVLTYDAFGQGEREIGGNQHRWFQFLALTGKSNLSFMVWDSIRALDYLLTRSDVDATRIAATGASGGGLNTLFLAVADPRITASIPVAYPTTFSAMIGTADPHDGCAYVPRLASFTDMDEIAGLFGGKPQLIMSGEFDPQFPIEGTLAVHAGAAARYQLLDAESSVRLVTFPVAHEYGRRMRETLYGFLGHVFGGMPEEPIDEPEVQLPAADSPEIVVSEGGHISTAGTEVQEFGREWARAAIERLPPVNHVDPPAFRRQLEALLRIPPRSPPVLREIGTATTAYGFEVRALEVEVAPGMSLPAYFVEAPERDAPLVVYADDGGVVSSGQLDHLHRAGLAVLYFPVRGRGETHWDEWSMFGDNLLLGDSVLGQRAFDLSQASQVARQLAPGAPIGLLAQGAITAAAAVASQALLLPYDAIAVGPLFPSYLQAWDRGIPYSAAVFDLLDTADVAHLAWLAADRPALIGFEEGAPPPPEHLDSFSFIERTFRLDLPEAARWLARTLR